MTGAAALLLGTWLCSPAGGAQAYRLTYLANGTYTYSAGTITRTDVFKYKATGESTGSIDYSSPRAIVEYQVRVKFLDSNHMALSDDWPSSPPVKEPFATCHRS